MPYPEGNQFWKLRSRHGSEANFTDPQKLLESAYEYFEEASKHKWVKKDWVGKDGKEVERETESPFSILRLCMFLGVNSQYFKNFKKSETYLNNNDFSLVVTHIEEIITSQQLEGAMVGVFKENIVSRLNGLVDKKETEIKGGLNVPNLPDIGSRK